MNNDINNTQKLRRLDSMSAEEFFGGGNVPVQDLKRAVLEDIPSDVVELANKMIMEDNNSTTPIIGGKNPHNNPNNPNVNIANVNVDGSLDIDLFQLAVGKDVVENINGIIKQHTNSIEQLRMYKHKLCQLLNIKEGNDE